ncbi:hypothetical protein HYX01_02685 [Candidatus Woesearchaeota archaeon]|nr:hypothetical protein [Candidatus Woesearchaeota archaeon]
MALEIISENPINTSKLKEKIAGVRQRDKEINFRAAKTEEHLEHITTLSNSSGLFNKINEMGIPRLKEQHIHKIIDVMPATVNSLKVVLQGYTLSLSNDNMKKIVDTLNEFLAKK